MKNNHLRQAAVIACIALAFVFSGCARKAKPVVPPPAPPDKPAAVPPQPEPAIATLERELVKQYTVTAPDGTKWKAFVTQVHQYNDGYYGVIIFGPPESEWESGLLRYDEATNDWEKSEVKIVQDGEEEYREPDTARTSMKWKVPREKLDAWIEQAKAEMKKQMKQS